MSEDITKDPEYIKGYQDTLAHYRRMEERQKTAYSKGSYAAFRDSMQASKAKSVLEEAKRIEKDAEALLESVMSSSQEQSETSPILEELRQLKEDTKKLDERLRRLEKYTEE